ncbi:MAG: hypothetical protein LBU88_03305 [Treponema sp.]|jgi:vacuolar-type H+-ATPase subunit H|nr:hypothetical protein [Treponema sp.]
MEQANTLDILLQVEAKAAGMVKDAQDEADRRIHDSEEKNRAAYEERYKAEILAQNNSLIENQENIKNEYKETLDTYRNDILQIEVNKERFSALINEYLEKG